MLTSPFAVCGVSLPTHPRYYSGTTVPLDHCSSANGWLTLDNVDSLFWLLTVPSSLPPTQMTERSTTYAELSVEDCENRTLWCVLFSDENPCFFWTFSSKA